MTSNIGSRSAVGLARRAYMPHEDFRLQVQAVSGRTKCLERQISCPILLLNRRALPCRGSFFGSESWFETFSYTYFRNMSSTTRRTCRINNTIITASLPSLLIALCSGAKVCGWWFGLGFRRWRGASSLNRGRDCHRRGKGR